MARLLDFMALSPAAIAVFVIFAAYWLSAVTPIGDEYFSVRQTRVTWEFLGPFLGFLTAFGTIFILMESAYSVAFTMLRGATPGQSLHRLKVVDQTGIEASFLQLSVRAIFNSLPLIIILMPLHLWALLRGYGDRSLGDLIAGARVARIPALSPQKAE